MNAFCSLIFLLILDVVILGGIYDEVIERLGTNIVYALIFYFINKHIFLLNESDDKLEKGNVNEVKKSKNIYCKKCGGKINDERKCIKCSKQYFRFNKNILFYIIIVALVISNITFIFIYRNEKKSNENTNDSFNVNNSLCKIKLYALTGKYDYDYVKEKLEFFDNNIVFVIEGYGDYYYTYDCVQKITYGEEYTYWSYNKEAAIYEGYQKGTCY